MANRTAKPATDFTYGVEIECYLPAGTIRAGGYHAGIRVPGLLRGWTAERDASLNSTPSGYRGVEIVSPILKGHDGLRQILTVTAKLNEWGARVNRTCGLHVHLGADRTDLKTLENFTHQMANHEKAVFASTGTKHRERGVYSRSIHSAWRSLAGRRNLSLADFNGVEQGHHVALNLQNLIYGTRPTVEVRAFAGTTNGTKICGHVQMAIAIFQKAQKSGRRPSWDAPAIATTSRSYRAAGPGSTALARLYYVIGWIKGVEKSLLGYFGDAEGVPTLKEIKKELVRLGRRYDRA